MLLRGFPADSVFLGALMHDADATTSPAAPLQAVGDASYPEWQRALDKHIGRTPGARRVISAEQFVGMVNEP